GDRRRLVRDWVVRHNVFDRRACATPSYRTIWFDAGSRDTVITDNLFFGSNYHVLFGGSPPSRTYADPIPATCTGTNQPDHYGGVICNNVIAAVTLPSDDTLEDFHEGIALWNACETWVLHNTIATNVDASEIWTTIEYRFDATYVHLVNNLAATLPMARENAELDPVYAASNVVYASTSEFVDLAAGNLRLSPAAMVPTG